MSYEVKDMAATPLLHFGVDANVRDAAHVLNRNPDLHGSHKLLNGAAHVAIGQHLREASEELIVVGDEAAVVLEASTVVHAHIMVGIPARQQPGLAALE